MDNQETQGQEDKDEVNLDTAESATAPSIDSQAIMNALKKAVDVSINPKGAWETIKSDNESTLDVYKKYLLFVCAIMPLALFIAMSIIGMGTPVGRIRAPFFDGLFRILFGYVTLLGFPYLVALATELLAPKLEMTVSRDAVFKLFAFAMMPALLCGALFLITLRAGTLFNLGLLYGIFIVYLGVPVLTEVPETKRLQLVGVIAAIAVVLRLIISDLLGIF